MADKSTGSQASSKPQNFSREEADRQPWRYRGYAAFTEWSASDDDFLVLRKFNAISIRVMLYLQDQIVVLEDDLRDVDQECRRASDELADGGTFRFDQWERRGQILTDLALHIKRYQRFVSDHLELKARPKASAHQIDNVKQWLKNAKKPITESEVAYLEQSEDLITMALKRKSPIRHVFDKFDIWRKIPGIRNTKADKERFDKADVESEATVCYHNRLIDILKISLTIFFGLGMLVGPIWALQYQEPSSQSCLAIISTFLTLFATSISILTNWESPQVLAAAAAYWIILVAFMQLVPGTGPQA